MKFKSFIFLLLICLSICSCKSFWNLFKKEEDKSKYRPVPPELFTRKDTTEIISGVDNTIGEKIENNFSESTNKYNESQTSIDRHKNTAELNEKNSKALNLAIENIGFYGKPKNELLSKLQNIQGKRKTNDEKILETEKSLKEISDYLSPTNMIIVRDRLIDEELNAFREKKPNTKLSQNEKQQIIERVSKKLSEIVYEKSQEFLKENQTLDILLMNENTYAFEIKELEVNLSLKKFIGVINNKSNFELGSDNLTTEGRRLITKDVSVFFDELFNKIPEIIAVRAIDSIKYEITLNISIDGFADSKGFGGASWQESKELNRDLSQKRSDNILHLALDIYNNKTKQVFIKNVSFTQPTISSIGHGEELPNPNGKYQPEGEDDSDRRITILQCTFSIKPK